MSIYSMYISTYSSTMCVYMYLIVESEYPIWDLT